MELVIGGAYQGKLEYVLDKYELNNADVFTCTEETEIDRSRRVIYHFERYLKYCLRKGISPDLSFREDSIVIMDDIFCGVVPVDKEIRAWREFCGRTGAELSKKAAAVTRIFCGLPQKLK